MLKKELENGYFTADDGKKIYWRSVGSLGELEFFNKTKTKRGKVIKELTFNHFPYKALLLALKSRYKWRIGQKLTHELDAREGDLGPFTFRNCPGMGLGAGPNVPLELFQDLVDHAIGQLLINIITSQILVTPSGQ